MTVRATVDIPAGAEIVHSYCEPTEPYLTRRSLLQLGKFFTCNCSRCQDPKELGTLGSAVACSKCKKGALLPAGPNNDVDADWNCIKCKKTTPCTVVQEKYLSKNAKNP